MEKPPPPPTTTTNNSTTTAYWYDQLKLSGFNDIEDKKERLKTHASSYFTAFYKHDVFEYYLAAFHFLHKHIFSTTIEKRVWELHTEGKGTREISALILVTWPTAKMNKDKAASIIRHLKEVMKEELKEAHERRDTRADQTKTL